MVPPVSSGRTWEPLPDNQPVIDPGRSVMRWLRDAEDHAAIALFKTPPPAAMAREEYAIAMDWVAFALGQELGVPVPPVYLEEFDGQWGAVLEFVENSITWLGFEKQRLSGRMVNEDDVPLCVVFDVWIANCDRNKRNFLLQPAPKHLAHEDAREYVLLLIDHGYTGLWPVGKFGLTGATDVPEQVVLAEDGATLAERTMRDRMPSAYRGQLAACDASVRQAAYARVQAISDELIDECCGKVPEPLMTGCEKGLTARLLKARRDNVDTLCARLVA